MDISKQMTTIVKSLKINFTLNQRPISVEEIFQETGLFVALARRADQLSSLCLGYGIGVTFSETENALLGVKAIFDDVTPNVLRYMCLLDVLFEIINIAPDRNNVSLDELMYD